MKKSVLVVLVALCTIATACAGGEVRWHFYPDGSVLLDSDAHGQRLVMPDEYQDALSAADEHYGEVNPDSYTDFGIGANGKHSFKVSFDVAPNHVLTQDELDFWLNEQCAKTRNGWWWYDLLLITYRNLEHKAQANAAEDPQRAQQELTQKRETAKIKAPSDVMIKRLAAHRIYYRDKTYTNDGSRTWTFSIKDTDPSSASEISFSVPAGSSEQTVYNEALESAVTYSSVVINGHRKIEADHRDWIIR